MAKLKCPRCFHVNEQGVDVCGKCGTRLPKISIELKDRSGPSGAPTPGIQFHRGQVVAKRYTVLNLVGRGGMGCIYKVHDNVLGEDVALKTLLPQFARDQEVVERFFNEAKIARKLTHPGIVRVHDIGSADGILYISMEFLQGKSLRGILESFPAGSRMPLRQVMSIFESLCLALQYAHSFTVHRDIKPENIMIGLDGGVKLMDFGISKLMANTRLTGASMVMGTPFYMSPEQLRNSRDVDARADVYSVGVMLYEVLTGGVPTGMAKPVSQLIREVPPALDVIVTKCIETNPNARFQTAGELGEALRPIREIVCPSDEGSRGLEGKGADVDCAGRSRTRKVVGMVLAVVLLVITAGAVYGLELRRLGKVELPSVFGRVRPERQEYDRLRALVEKVRVVAERESRGSETLQAMCENAASTWTLAQGAVSGSIGLGTSLAREALQCFLAPLMESDTGGMVFVPPGRVAVVSGMESVGAFFIDEAEVTMGEYRRFVQEVSDGWRWPFGSNYDPRWDNYPMVGVTFYDAQAFAAWSGKRLPTEGQWSRSAYNPDSMDDYPWGHDWKDDGCNCNVTEEPVSVEVRSERYASDITSFGCYDMAGNVAEWTRTAYEKSEANVTFGTALVVRGGDYRSLDCRLQRRQRMLYEERADTVGFRCVVEIPTDDAQVRMLMEHVR